MRQPKKRQVQGADLGRNVRAPANERKQSNNRNLIVFDRFLFGNGNEGFAFLTLFGPDSLAIRLSPLAMKNLLKGRKCTLISCKLWDGLGLERLKLSLTLQCGTAEPSLPDPISAKT